MYFQVIEIILSTISLICTILMVLVYFRNEQLQIFSYTVQIYAIIGACLFSLLDCIYNWCVMFSNSQNQFICEIIAYISVFGIMNVVSWTTMLMKVTKIAILQRKKEQLAKHLTLMAFAFTLPIILTIFPQLINESIYGLYGNVCWLSYDPKEENLQVTITSLLFFFFPVCIFSSIQFYDNIQINRKIQQLKSNNQIFKGNQNHINALKSIQFYSIFFLSVWTVPTLFYILQLSLIEIQSIIPFEIFRCLLSTIGIVILIIQSFNKQCQTMFLDMFRKRRQSIYDVKIDLFEGLEDFPHN